MNKTKAHIDDSKLKYVKDSSDIIYYDVNEKPIKEGHRILMDWGTYNFEGVVVKHDGEFKIKCDDGVIVGFYLQGDEIYVILD